MIYTACCPYVPESQQPTIVRVSWITSCGGIRGTPYLMGEIGEGVMGHGESSMERDNRSRVWSYMIAWVRDSRTVQFAVRLNETAERLNENIRVRYLAGYIGLSDIIQSSVSHRPVSTCIRKHLGDTKWPHAYDLNWNCSYYAELICWPAV